MSGLILQEMQGIGGDYLYLGMVLQLKLNKTLLLLQNSKNN
jgi:hypothetical protein